MSKDERIEELVLADDEIEAKIRELKKERMKNRAKEQKEKKAKVRGFNDLSEEEVYSLGAIYEVNDYDNETPSFINGVQLAGLFGLDDAARRMFAQKKLKNEVQIKEMSIKFKSFKG